MAGRNHIVAERIERIKKEVARLQAMPEGARNSSLEAGYNGLLEDILERLLPHAAERMGLPLKLLRNNVKGVSVRFSPEINACRDPQTSMVHVNVGLMTFFHTMITVLMARTGLGVLENDSPDRVVLEPSLPFETACTLADRVMNDFYQRKLCEARPEGTLLSELNNAQLFFWQRYLDFAESFVVAHELGHLALSLCPEKLDLDIGLWATQKYLSTREDLSGPKKQSVLEHWADEIAADFFSLRLLPALGNDNFERVLAYSSVELTFLLMNMLEVFCERRIGTPPPIGYHPPSWFRLGLVRLAAVNSNPPELVSLGLSYQTLTESILDAVCPE